MSRIDLHGMTVHTAWKKYRNTTQDCYHKQVKKITVITGHGQMSAEFQGWVSADPFALSCERQNPNTGSWTVRIKKNSNVTPIPEPVDLTGLYKKFNR
jgi:DNA-nicking Smr family endonuclease